MRHDANRWHPWRYLRDHPHIYVEWVRLYGQRARTNGVDLIELEMDSLQVDRRCDLSHEIIHVEEGHEDGCENADEQYVIQATAHRLIPIADLARAMAWSADRAEQAEELWVTRAVLDDRLAHLHWSERGYLERATAHRRDVC